MKRFALFYVLLSFAMMVFASCEKPNDDDIDKEDAEAAKAKLEEAGAKVELK